MALGGCGDGGDGITAWCGDQECVCVCGLVQGLSLCLSFLACKMGWLISSGFCVVDALTEVSAESMRWL